MFGNRQVQLEDKGYNWQIPSYSYVGDSRTNFITKVFFILSIQLSITFLIVGIFSFVDSVKTYVQTHSALLIIAIVLSFVFIIVLVCCRNVAKSYPLNYIILGLFTLCEGYLLGAVSSTYDTTSVFYAVLITFFVTIALMTYAKYTKTDFTGIGGYLFVILIVFILFGIIASIICSQSCQIINIVYSGVGALIFSIYLVYDTQMIYGNHKNSYEDDEHVYAALSLYLDIINLFLYILQLLDYFKN